MHQDKCIETGSRCVFIWQANPRARHPEDLPIVAFVVFIVFMGNEDNVVQIEEKSRQCSLSHGHILVPVQDRSCSLCIMLHF
jgi:hypothetical protein